MGAVVKCAELFAGVGGFRLGIEQSGLPARFVYANEIDRHACAVYRHVWCPATELVEGDVREQDTTAVPGIDFLVAGFPCQSFSVAGKLGGFQDTRGTLFFEVARFLADKRPRHFLLENVKNLVGHDEGKTFQTVLGVLAHIGYRVEWEVLNSTCWVPQNRERVFIIGHLGGECGRTVFPLREDGGIPDTICTEAQGKGKRVWDAGDQSASALRLGGSRIQDNLVSATLNSRYYEDGSECVLAVKGDLSRREHTVDEGNHQAGISHRNLIVIHENKSGTQTPHDEAAALRSGASHNYQKVALPDSAMALDQDGYLRLTGARPRDENGKPQLLPIGCRRFRRLTPVECERLQGWPDLHTAIGLYRAVDLPKSMRNGNEYVLNLVSDTQRYRMTGNGVTADVVREVVKKMMLVGCFG